MQWSDQSVYAGCKFYVNPFASGNKNTKIGWGKHYCLLVCLVAMGKRILVFILDNSPTQTYKGRYKMPDKFATQEKSSYIHDHMI